MSPSGDLFVAILRRYRLPAHTRISYRYRCHGHANMLFPPEASRQPDAAADACCCRPPGAFALMICLIRWRDEFEPPSRLSRHRFAADAASQPGKIRAICRSSVPAAHKRTLIRDSRRRSMSETCRRAARCAAEAAQKCRKRICGALRAVVNIAPPFAAAPVATLQPPQSATRDVAVHEYHTAVSSTPPLVVALSIVTRSRLLKRRCRPTVDVLSAPSRLLHCAAAERRYFAVSPRCRCR